MTISTMCSFHLTNMLCISGILFCIVGKDIQVLSLLTRNYIVTPKIRSLQLSLMLYSARRTSVRRKINMGVVFHSATLKLKCKSLFTERACSNLEVHLWLSQEFLHSRNTKAGISLATCTHPWYPELWKRAL